MLDSKTFTIKWTHEGKFKSCEMEFDAEGKTGKDLKEEITEYLAANSLGYGDFTMKQFYVLIPLNKKLNWHAPYLSVELFWGTSYVNPSQTATLIE